MAFSLAALCYIFALILGAALLFFAIYHIISFDDLKSDYKNPVDQCASLNTAVLPEYGTHVIVCLLLLATSQWAALAANVPLLAYHVVRYLRRPAKSGFGLYDPASVASASSVSWAMREGWIKLSFYLLTFFYYLYSMIYVLVTAN